METATHTPDELLSIDPATISESIPKPLSQPKKIPAHEIIDCIHIKGMSVAQTAKYLKCTKSNITQRLQVLGITPGGVQKYKSNRADLLAYYQLQLLKTLTPTEIKKMSPGSRVTCFGILYDKERLERGQSTQNMAVINAKYQSEIDAIEPKLSRKRIAQACDIPEAEVVQEADIEDYKLE